MIVKTLLIATILATGEVREIPWPSGFEDCIAFSDAMNMTTVLVDFSCTTTVTDPQKVSF